MLRSKLNSDRNVGWEKIVVRSADVDGHGREYVWLYIKEKDRKSGKLEDKANGAKRMTMPLQKRSKRGPKRQILDARGI